VQLSRTVALDILADTIESSHVVVVQGAPGSGKSAIVKMLFEALPNGIVPFAFKAQEFNYPHLHQFLTAIGLKLSVAQLRCEFALLPRKLLLVDGAERLFELSNHEAFRHLLDQLRDDNSWTVVITCRESSAQTLREHLLAQWGDDVTTVTIPSLSTDELEWVSLRLPGLAPLIANQRLTRLLKLPFILSLAWKAFSLHSSTETGSGIDERQFKEIVWRDYVERVSQAKGGLPIKRNQCLLSISVERARRMSLFVSPEGHDAEVLHALVDDGILVKSIEGGFAPAHDVLEDWAVSRFVAQLFEAKSDDPLQFVNVVGTEPAMRRGFRMWLMEALAASHNQHVMDFVVFAFQRANVPPIWRDEIAVAVLQSENVGQFINTVEPLLLGGNKALYRRLVHVLRTACKGPNESLLRALGLAAFRSHVTLGSVFIVPVGSGWQELILFTHRNLAAFDLQDTNTVLGLLKDWAQGLGPSDQLPAEARAVAQICLKYWGLLTAPNLYADRQEQEFLELLFKIPHAAADEVTTLIRSALANELAREYHSRTVLEHVTKSMECQSLCAHFPDLVMEVAEATWKLKPDDQLDYQSRPDLDEVFGFDHYKHFEYFPQSSLQGPFMFLLGSHPEIAVEFIVRLANQAALSYSQSRLSHEVCSVKLWTETGSRLLTASPRLWALYRGMMPGSPILECALMSLEAWLLGQAEQNNDIRAVFRKILNTSSSAATVAVLASVATAYPGAVKDEVLPLLGVQEFYRWDLERSTQEHLHATDVRSSLGIPTGGVEEVYYLERKNSSGLPHRKSNLEELAFRLQWTPLRDKVLTILDNFYKALPPEREQSSLDKMWRIALHRMDARHFKAEEAKEPGKVILTPGEPTPDLQQFIADRQEKLAPTNRHMRLAMWGMTQFRQEAQSMDAFPDWRTALREAQALYEQKPSEADEAYLGRSGPGFVAAYLLRDHYAELDPSELEWCRRLVIEVVLSKDAERNFNTRISKNPFDGSRPCAFVLPLLLRSAADSQTRSQIEECLAVGVTHTSEEVRGYAAAGVRSWLWDIDPDLAKACVGGLCQLAGVKNQIREEWRSKRFSRGVFEEWRGKRLPRDVLENAIWAATKNFRARIVKRETANALISRAVSLETHDWPELLDALNMIRHDTDNPHLRSFFVSCLAALLRDAEAAESWRSNRHANFESQHEFAPLFARFTLARPVTESLQIAQLLGDYVEKCPKFLAVLLETLPYEEDRVRSGEVFWSIWKSLSGPIFEHPLLRVRDSSHTWRCDEMRKLVRILLFADIKWKESVKEWEPVSANKHFIEHAASIVGNTPAGFGALLSLLCSVGQFFLPAAIKLLADAVENASGRDLLDDLNAAFDLEVVLRKVCYGFTTDIRKRPDLHRAVILLLDKLVERGSHTGFRLRDYIIAPLPTAE